MSKKDYEAAARRVQEVARFDGHDAATLAVVVDTFAAFFRADGFRRACVPGANVRARGSVYAAAVQP